MATRLELSVGGTTDVPSLADQIKRFQPRVFSQVDGGLGVFDRSAKVSLPHILYARIMRRARPVELTKLRCFRHTARGT